MVSYLHPLHTEDTSTCSQGMVRMARPRPLVVTLTHALPPLTFQARCAGGTAFA